MQRSMIFIVAGVIAVAGIIIFSFSGSDKPEAPVAKREVKKVKEPVKPRRSIKKPVPAPVIPDIIPEAEEPAPPEAEPLPEVTDKGEKNPFAGMLPDEAVRTAANPLKLNAEANQWLIGSNLASKIVSIVSAVAKGEFPHQQLTALSPKKSFTELNFQDEAQLDVSVYERYTPMAQFIGSLDAQAVADAIKLLEPILEPAHRELGQPGKFKKELLRAIRAVLSVRATQFRVPLKQRVLIYTFADEKLEASNSLTKLMYRIGPNNSMLIQAKLKEIRQLL